MDSTKPLPDRWKEALRRGDLFAALDEAALDYLTSSLEEKQFAAGEHLVRQGEEADSLFVIVEGEVDVLLEGDESILLRRMGPGGVIGEIALVLGGKRSASVRAAETTCVLVLSRERFEHVLDRHPQMMAPLSRDLSERMRRGKVAVFLQELFGPLDPDALSEIERQVTWVHFDSGRELFRQGDKADGAYLVIAGRLRVVVGETAGGERVIDETGPGQWVGEMALLTGKERSATVYALRDTELIWLSQATFDSLITNHPRALREMTRVLVSRMQRQMGGERTPRAVRKTFAIVPASPNVNIDELTINLATSLRAYGSVLHLTADKVDEHLGKKGIARMAGHAAQVRLVPWLIEQEERYDVVIYQADDRWTGWTERSVRHADHILIVANGRASPETSQCERSLASCFDGARAPTQSLVLLQDKGRGATESFPSTGNWLAKRRVDSHYHVQRGMKSDVARLARILTGRAICLVLGGGGSRGYAHLGVLRAFEELGIPIDAVGGTSIGALVATGTAFGWSWNDMITRLPPILARGFSRVTLPMVSLLSGTLVTESLREILGTLCVEDAAIPLFCVSTNLTRGGEVVHRSGSAVLAVRASTSIPGLFPPVSFNGDLLVDGGVSNNVPVDTMLSLFGGAVVAVDVMPEIDLQASGQLPLALSGWTVARQRLNPFSDAVSVPDILNILVRSATAASHGMIRAEMSARLAALYLRPQVTKWNIVDFKAATPVADEGYRATIPTITKWWLRHRDLLLGRS